jgi:hypothetical protein
MSRMTLIMGNESPRRWGDEERAGFWRKSRPSPVVTDVARRADGCATLVYRWRREALKGAEASGFAPVLIKGAVAALSDSGALFRARPVAISTNFGAAGAIWRRYLARRSWALPVCDAAGQGPVGLALRDGRLVSISAASDGLSARRARLEKSATDLATSERVVGAPFIRDIQKNVGSPAF